MNRFVDRNVRTSKRLIVGLLILGLLAVSCGRGYWVIEQCLHASQTTMHMDAAHQGYVDHHHHSGLELLDEADSATHQLIHVMDSIEYSVPVLLAEEDFRSPLNGRVSDLTQHPPDFIPFRLYRPPRA